MIAPPFNRVEFMTNQLPPLEKLREHLEFSADGVITLRKKTSPKDRREVGDVLGSEHGNGYLRLRIFHGVYFVHRLVFYHFNGWCPDLVDHKDRNRKNNHPDNLRPATHSENHINGLAYKTKRPRHSKFRGVTKSGDYWIAQMKVRGRQRVLGRFYTELAARDAYLKGVRKHYPDFAPSS